MSYNVIKNWAIFLVNIIRHLIIFTHICFPFFLLLVAILIVQKLYSYRKCEAYTTEAGNVVLSDKWIIHTLHSFTSQAKENGLSINNNTDLSFQEF